MRRALLTSFLVSLIAAVALGDATVEQKSQVHFSGALGGVINVFGGKSTHEGLVSTSVVRGERKSTRSGDSGEIIDLDQEKVYRLDYGRKSYTVKTFDELRKEFEDSQKRAEERSTRENKGEEPQYEVDFDIKSTGKKETINGWDTHEEIITITVHEKGKPIEKSGGWILTSDLAMGPKIAAMNELTSFERRFVQKLYGKGFDTDMRTMAAALAATPAFAKAMKAFGEHRSGLSGTPIRTVMRFETIAGTEQKQEESSGGLMGGLMNRMKKNREEKQAGPERSELFEGTTELLKASGSASASEVAIPADFKQR